jgi:hypothetical protein
MTVVPFHLTFLFPRLKIKLKDRHFDTIVEAEAELLGALNTLKEHNFQDAFIKRLKRLEGCIIAEEGLTLMAASRPKLVFDQMAAPIPEIIDGSFYIKELKKNFSENAFHGLITRDREQQDYNTIQLNFCW